MRAGTQILHLSGGKPAYKGFFFYMNYPHLKTCKKITTSINYIQRKILVYLKVNQGFPPERVRTRCPPCNHTKGLAFVPTPYFIAIFLYDYQK